MFDFFRKYNKFAMVFLFLLIIPSFVLFGVERYNQSGGKDEAVAEVDGLKITRPEWDAQHRIETDRIRQRAPNIDAALLDSDAARYATLERMVRDRVLAVAANKSNLAVSDERLARLFAEEPGLASFRTPDGKFDRQAFMRATNQTPEQYEAGYRAQLATQQVLLGVSGTGFVPKAQVAATLDAVYDRREVQVARFNLADFTAKVDVSDADLEAWYKSHAAQFQMPESASIEYLVLDLEAVKKTIAVSEADLKSYYEQNKERFASKEERRASHIEIKAPSTMPAAEREKAKAKADKLQAELKLAPNTFADVARKQSEDELSARNGGALDMGPRGSFGSPALEDAMFSLKPGDVSAVVETEFGYHIVRVNEIKPAVVQPFDQVRAAIENEVRTQQVTQEFAKAAETFTDLVYQQADSLQPAADKLKLAIQKASGVGRTPAPGATGVLGSRAFLAALYEPDTLERKHNTKVIEIGGSTQLASGRIDQHTPARALPFAEVKDKVRAQVVGERSAALAKAEGTAKLAAWQADGAGAKLGAPVTISRVDATSQPAQLIEAVLRADTAKLPTWVGVDLGPQGYAVARIDKVLPPVARPPEQAQQESAQFSQALGAAENEAYYNLLKERFKVRFTVPKPAPAVRS